MMRERTPTGGRRPTKPAAQDAAPSGREALAGRRDRGGPRRRGARAWEWICGGRPSPIRGAMIGAVRAHASGGCAPADRRRGRRRAGPERAIVAVAVAVAGAPWGSPPVASRRARARWAALLPTGCGERRLAVRGHFTHQSIVRIIGLCIKINEMQLPRGIEWPGGAGAAPARTLRGCSRPIGTTKCAIHAT